MNKSVMIILLLSIAVVLSLAGLVFLYLDYLELQQYYEWALEIAKLSPEEREYVPELIQKNNDYST